MTEKLDENSAIARLNSKQWRFTPEGYVITIDDLEIEARQENQMWRARARCGRDQADIGSLVCQTLNWSHWTPHFPTRWQAALTARGQVYEQQGELSLD